LPGFTAIGFPCDQFLNQEPGDNDEILNTLYYVRPGNKFVPSFPLTQKTHVNGDDAHPVWNFIRNVCPGTQSQIVPVGYPLPGWQPIQMNDVQWNFETVLVSKSGIAYKRYNSNVDPMLIQPDIEYLLSQ
jgi:glutathione peroxidase